MKHATFLSLAALASQVSYTTADSVCSSGLYAALAPLDTYPPAVTYCQGQAGKATVTVTKTAATAKVKRVPATTSNTQATANTKATATTLKTSTTTTGKDAKASAWSSLVAQAKSVIATFCSCAGYPATVTTTTTSTPTPTPSAPAGVYQMCSDGSNVLTKPANQGPLGASACTSICEDTSDYGLGCFTSQIDSSGNCILYYSCCPNNDFCT